MTLELGFCVRQFTLVILEDRLVEKVNEYVSFSLFSSNLNLGWEQIAPSVPARFQNPGDNLL